MTRDTAEDINSYVLYSIFLKRKRICERQFKRKSGSGRRLHDCRMEMPPTSRNRTKILKLSGNAIGFYKEHFAFPCKVKPPEEREEHCSYVYRFYLAAISRLLAASNKNPFGLVNKSLKHGQVEAGTRKLLEGSFPVQIALI